MYRRYISTLAVTALLVLSLGGAPTVGAVPAESLDKERREAIEEVEQSIEVINEMMGIAEQTIPEALLKDAECIAIFPNVFKGAFVFGGSGGDGLAVCRDPRTGRWGTPLFLEIGGGSWGAQIGASWTDFVLVGVNRDAQKALAKGRWTVGADAAVAAGPVGRSAKAGTDWTLSSQFVSYSRSKGLFAGVALDGAKIMLDDDANPAVYGPRATPEQILMGRAKANAAVSREMMMVAETLAKYTRPMPD